MLPVEQAVAGAVRMVREEVGPAAIDIRIEQIDPPETDAGEWRVALSYVADSTGRKQRTVAIRI